MITRRVCQQQRQKASCHCQGAFGVACWLMACDERGDCYGDTISLEGNAGRSKPPRQTVEFVGFVGFRR